MFVALPVPVIIGVTEKIVAVPGYAHAPFSPKFLMGFCSDGVCERAVQSCAFVLFLWRQGIYK